MEISKNTTGLCGCLSWAEYVLGTIELNATDEETVEEDAASAISI